MDSSKYFPKPWYNPCWMLQQTRGFSPCDLGPLDYLQKIPSTDEFLARIITFFKEFFILLVILNGACSMWRPPMKKSILQTFPNKPFGWVFLRHKGEDQTLLHQLDQGLSTLHNWLPLSSKGIAVLQNLICNELMAMEHLWLKYYLFYPAIVFHDNLSMKLTYVVYVDFFQKETASE